MNNKLSDKHASAGHSNRFTHPRVLFGTHRQGAQDLRVLQTNGRGGGAVENARQDGCERGFDL
jgi:hypothetical protein